MKKIIFIISILIAISAFWFPFNKAGAREYVSDWYIKDFQSTIVVNEDSTLDITERITADCGTLPDKHGIFRVLPTVANTGTEEIKTPVDLIGITDFDGKKIPYSTDHNLSTHTITYKIGDADKTVTGVNYYQIKYKIKNTIRFANPEFDELYWNLNGNFWEIETDHFKANITFPDEVSEENTQIDYYAGIFGSKDKSLATYRWTDGNILEVESIGTLLAREGITLSAAMPKNIFTPYVLTQADEKQYLDYSEYFKKYYPTPYAVCTWFLALIFPIIIFILCFSAWKKYGDDPGKGRSVMPEFEIPDKLTPMELGLIYSNGSLRPTYFAAALINLAVKGVIKIEEVDKKWVLGKKDYKLIWVDKKIALSISEKLIVDKLFTIDDNLLISSLQKDSSFYFSLQNITKMVKNDLKAQDLLDITGTKYKIGFIIAGLFMLVGSFFVAIVFLTGSIGMIISAIILVIFAILMPKRTVKGMDLYYKILGFKLYMDTAEKYRQPWNEKENIFEKFLPYAILFGIAKEWTKKMKILYKNQMIGYHPFWYIGGDMNNFDFDSFASTITAVSSAVGTASGAGGSGGAGGGGGGGGGGGW